MSTLPITSPISDGCSGRAYAITPSNTVILAPFTRFVWVGGAGNLAVLMNGDTVPVTLVGVPAGVMLNISVQQVLATGTTATNIVGLY